MRKLFSFAAAAALCISLHAVPAKPGVHRHVQPDGSVVDFVVHGDEFCHWVTDTRGRLIEEGADGYFRPSAVDLASLKKRGALSRRNANAMRTLRPRYNPAMTTGERNILVILVNFSDVAFTLDDPLDAFSRLLNEESYSDNGGTGSVRDFYIDNSNGVFRPTFDVAGPVTLKKKMAEYGGNVSGNDKAPELALYEACKGLDAEVDFSQYDSDGDGFVDMILFYYAGYNEAEGGPPDSIWPHQWSAQYSSDAKIRNARFDGVGLGNYFCTSEYKGRSGSNMCGIGTTCHEFAHSLGLPDFYDTDYQTNGTSGCLYSFSTMCSGPYNNDGRTPPYFNIIEREMLGWAESPVTIESTGSFQIPAIQNGMAYSILSSTENEYFVFECRNGQNWDKPLPAGMLVYHVDKSERMVKTQEGNFSAADLWNHWEEYNNINSSGTHPCFYIIPAADQGSLYYHGGASGIVFPGYGNVTDYQAVDWEGRSTDVSLSGIIYSDGTVRFTARSVSNPIPSDRIHLDEMGYCYIALQSGEYRLTVPEGFVPSDILWSVDGETYQTGAMSVSPDLPGGLHEIEVSFRHPDGGGERIRAVFNVDGV